MAGGAELISGPVRTCPDEQASLYKDCGMSGKDKESYRAEPLLKTGYVSQAAMPAAQPTADLSQRPPRACRLSGSALDPDLLRSSPESVSVTDQCTMRGGRYRDDLSGAVAQPVQRVAHRKDGGQGVSAQHSVEPPRQGTATLLEATRQGSFSTK